jgi:hypothetical protein
MALDANDNCAITRAFFLTPSNQHNYHKEEASRIPLFFFSILIYTHIIALPARYIVAQVVVM